MADETNSEQESTPVTPGKAGKKAGGLGNLVQAESMVQMALAVPAGCFAGLLIGALLDRHYHTHWMVIVGMMLGAAGGFVQIFQLAARSGKGRQ